MALNGIVLGDAIKVALDAAAAGTPAASEAQRTAIWRAIGTAIVTHIQTQGTVVVAVASVSGVTTGPGVSGPGAGTGSIV